MVLFRVFPRWDKQLLASFNFLWCYIVSILMWIDDWQCNWNVNQQCEIQSHIGRRPLKNHYHLTKRQLTQHVNLIVFMLGRGPTQHIPLYFNVLTLTFTFPLWTRENDGPTYWKPTRRKRNVTMIFA
jgi:hypothetical protein